MIHVCIVRDEPEREDENVADGKRKMCVHEQRKQYNRLWIEILAEAIVRCKAHTSTNK